MDVSEQAAEHSHQHITACQHGGRASVLRRTTRAVVALLLLASGMMAGVAPVV